MTRSNPSSLVATDPEIKRIALRNLRARIKQEAEGLELDLEDTQS